jgi:hypothetical protein
MRSVVFLGTFQTEILRAGENDFEHGSLPPAAVTGLVHIQPF